MTWQPGGPIQVSPGFLKEELRLPDYNEKKTDKEQIFSLWMDLRNLTASCL